MTVPGFGGSSERVCTKASIMIAWLVVAITSATAFGQSTRLPSSESVRAGGIEFQFATLAQGRELLEQEDSFLQNLSPFDRQARMQLESDPGKDDFRQFLAGEVIEWTEQDRAAIGKAIEGLDKALSDLDLPDVGPVMLVCTTGREESDAGYTRGSTIVLPRGKAGSISKPPMRLITHELFHVLSRADHRWRDRLYSIIGFQPINEIKLPESMADRRITNPDAPQISHAIKVRLGDDQTALVAPVLLAKSRFRSSQPSLFSYIDFKLMEVEQDAGGRWVAKTVHDEVVLHDPSIPDFHRQIGANTGYIIHPDEILADNFVILVTGTKARDEWVIDAMRSQL